MKLYMECPTCGHLVPVSKVSVKNGHCMVQCADCQHQEEIQLDVHLVASGTQVATQASPEALCPKCGHIRKNDTASCPRCGLVFALWKPPAKPFADFPQLAELWQKLETQPVSSAQHDRFLEACFQQGALPEAARVYKKRLQDEPEAAARLRQIELLSQMRFVPKSVSSFRWWRWLVWFLLVLTLLGAMYLMTITPEDLMR